jgi:hypothetical protein
MALIHTIHRISRRIHVRGVRFLCAYMNDIKNRLCLAILFLIFGRSDVFVSILGFVALGLESTLPIPQLIR